jgi:hypothetical protein
MLNRIDVTKESWDSISTLIQKLLQNIQDTHGKSMGSLPFNDEGLSQIPLTNKQWASWVGYEHEEQTLWFSVSLKRSPSGFLVKQTYGAPALMPLVKSVVWNTALYIHFLKSPVAPEAMRKALHQSLLEDSNCPQDLIPLIVSMAHKLCKEVLLVVCNDRGEINRCGLQLLKDNLDATMGARTCTNKALRRQVCMQLVAQGIATLDTRIQQNNRIIRYLKGVNNLKGSAVRAIERMLLLDKELLKMNNGVAILLPYTESERVSIRRDSHRLQYDKANRNRAEAIKKKMANGEKLIPAERKFKSVHKELFK